MKKTFWLQPKVIIAYAMGLLASAETIDSTIITVSIPQMMNSLGTTIDKIGGVSTSYIILNAIFCPIAGLAIKRLNMRTVIVLAASIFAISSMLCGISESLSEMLFFRSLQGLGGAFLPAVAQAYIMKTFTGNDRKKMMLLLGGIMVIGPIIGPVLGSIITQDLNWRYIFFVNAPICTFGIAIILLFMKPEKTSNEKLDYISFIFMALGIGFLQYIIDRGSEYQWFQSIEIWILLLLSMIFLFLFILRGIYGMSVVNFELFKDSNFVWNNIVIFISSMVGSGAIIYFPAMLQQIYHYSIEDSGFLQAPRGIAALLSAPFLPWLCNILGSRVVLFMGILGFSMTCFYLASFGVVPSIDKIIIVTSIQGIAIMAMVVPSLTLSAVGISKTQSDDASGILNFHRNMGSSVGISIASTITYHQMNISYHDLSQHVSPYTVGYPLWAQNFKGTAQVINVELANAQTVLQSTLIGFIDTFYFFAILILLFLWMPFVLKAPSGEKKIIIKHIYGFLKDCMYLLTIAYNLCKKKSPFRATASYASKKD